jgi:hypothetical protein
MLAARSVGEEERGEVVLLRDQGDLLIRQNPLDLDGQTLRFIPGRNGYAVVPQGARPALAAGTPVLMGREEPVPVPLPFAFPFFGREYGSAVVHADGYIGFEAGPPPGPDRSLPRFLAGPPGIAAFFADFGIDRAGAVSTHTTPTQLVVTWADLPGATQANRNTFQAVLSADGSIELSFTRLETREGIVGLTPGGRLEVVPRDLSAGLPVSEGAVAEVFSESERLDLVSTVRRFYRAYPDVFQQIVVYTTRPLNPIAGTFAFELNIKNETSGIGVPMSDASADWGSAGALESVVFLDSMESYRDADDFEILAHEVAHRWLARLRFRDGGGPSDALLTGDRLHWSFFLDSDASMIGGNDIAETSAGRFETIDFARRFSPLDQYAMGLRGPEEVPPFVLVEGADQFRPNRGYRASSSPEAGVRFTGRRRLVTIDDVVNAMGARTPPARQAPRILRQAYLLVGDAVAPPTAGRADVVDGIRSRFEPFFEAATDGRGRLETRLP